MTIRRHFIRLAAAWGEAGRVGLPATVAFNGSSEPHEQQQRALRRGHLKHCRPGSCVLE